MGVVSDAIDFLQEWCENLFSDGIIMQMAMLLGYTAALVFTILRTNAVSRSIFNAH